MTQGSRMTEGNDFIEFWTLEDSITTVVEANGHTVWRISTGDGVIEVELNEHLDDESASRLCGQFPLAADLCGEGDNGTIFALYQAQ